jgi:hypothetical protein
MPTVYNNGEPAGKRQVVLEAIHNLQLIAERGQELSREADPLTYDEIGAVIRAIDGIKRVFRLWQQFPNEPARLSVLVSRN